MKSTKPTTSKKAQSQRAKQRRELVRDNKGEYCILNATEDTVVRTNAFGLEETLDRRSYQEAQEGENKVTELLEEYLNNIQPSRTLRKLKKVDK